MHTDKGTEIHREGEKYTVRKRAIESGRKV